MLPCWFSSEPITTGHFFSPGGEWKKLLRMSTFLTTGEVAAPCNYCFSLSTWEFGDGKEQLLRGGAAC